MNSQNNPITIPPITTTLIPIKIFTNNFLLIPNPFLIMENLFYLFIMAFP